MKWVKASERLPEKMEAHYIMKDPKSRAIWYEWIDDSNFRKKLWKDNADNGYEWLDESDLPTESPKGSEGYSRSDMYNAWNEGGDSSNRLRFPEWIELYKKSHPPTPESPKDEGEEMMTVAQCKATMEFVNEKNVQLFERLHELHKFEEEAYNARAELKSKDEEIQRLKEENGNLLKEFNVACHQRDREKELVQHWKSENKALKEQLKQK